MEVSPEMFAAEQTRRRFIEAFTFGRRLHLSRSLKPKTSTLGNSLADGLRKA
jgi:hypothetical protein